MKPIRYHALITDYDGTLTCDEKMSATTLSALYRIKYGGRKLILATGRRLEEIKSCIPEYQLFDRIVAENGALIFSPDTAEIHVLGEQPPIAFIEYLQQKGVPLSLGQIIIGAWEPHQNLILEAIKLFGLEHQVIFNKGAVMILPPGVNKASGVQHALKSLNLSYHNAVVVGDAENDCSMFMAVECAVAVQNALAHVKDIADWITELPAGQGVGHLISRLVDDDLASLDPLLSRHFLPIGIKAGGDAFEISPFCTNLLLAGSSGCGKTTLGAAFLEALTAKEYQYCLVDPEGDYNEISGALTLGTGNEAPSIDHALHLLAKPEENVVLCIVAVPLEDRPSYFKKLMSALTALRHRTGHPHFIILDEAHHLVPKQSSFRFNEVYSELDNFFAITTTPELLDNEVLRRVNIAMIMGNSPSPKLSYITQQTCEQLKIPQDMFLENEQVLVWEKNSNDTLVFKTAKPRKLLMRHKKKYAVGEMGQNSFYFKGPLSKLNLKANNLMVFIQIAKGIDDDTWQYHRYRHDYSTWFRLAVKDQDLASLCETVENSDATAYDSRKKIFKNILDRYTLPA
jgi:hydroxymethylpyrimidine pyrophosphatase-like HAD family hydrolase